MHQLLLADILKFTISVLILENLLWSTVPRTVSPPCTILVNNTYYIFVDIDCTNLIRRIYMSNSNIYVEFLSRDLPLNNSAIMVKLKCLKLLYSLKVMCRIDSQLKKVTLNTLSPVLSGIDKNNFSFFWLFQSFLFVFGFTTLKKKTFIFKYF